jgi:hypothetical protein
MPRINRRKRKRKTLGLSGRQELDLILGDALGAFETPTERERAWFLHREELMQDMGPMTRPAAFWDYEHEKLPREKCAAALRRLRLFTPEEERIAAVSRAMETRSPSTPPGEAGSGNSE